MMCHNCGCRDDGTGFCPHCGADMVLMEKARNASLRQYNKGVALAKEGDYSGAIACLNRCILIDKRNHVARNLLGIAYYQVGMVSDALKHWIISASIKPKNNPAEKYIASLQKNARLLEKYNDAIYNYNKALSLFKQGSADLAVIQMKKAISLSPNFVEAYNLLAAYYLSIDDKESAREYVSMALKSDKRNARAMYYLSIISAGFFDKGASDNKKRTTNQGYNAKTKLREFIRPELFTFAIGAIAVVLLFVTLVLPSYVDVKDKKIESLETQIAQLKDENENGTSAFALKYAKLEEEIENLKEENKKHSAEESKRQQKIDYQLAEAYTVSERYEEAAKLLSGLEENVFTSEENVKIEEMKQICYTPAAEIVYNKGSELFSAGNLPEAKEQLMMSLGYTDEADFSDDVMYILGQILEAEGDDAQAAEYYARVVNEFSDSNVFAESEEKLNELLSQSR